MVSSTLPGTAKMKIMVEKPLEGINPRITNIVDDAKFRRGDKVRIVKLAAKAWIHKEEWKRYIEAGMTAEPKPDGLVYEDETMYYIDPSAGRTIGSEGRIVVATRVQGIEKYSIQWDKEVGHPYVAWYNNSQLEKIK